jgi:acyl carrier protein
MTVHSKDSDLRTRCLRVLHAVAPDAEEVSLDPALPLRQQIDFDSMDQLNVALGLHREFGIDIPEQDYPKLASLDGMLDYLGQRGC